MVATNGKWCDVKIPDRLGSVPLVVHLARMTEPRPHPSRPAATCVIFRRAASGPDEILMQRRSEKMEFAGGMAVFPGGRVDEADFALADNLAAGDRDDMAARIAAIRETLEESGLAIGLNENIDADQARAARSMLDEIGALEPVLRHFGWTLDLDALTPFARWHPRHAHFKVYDTRFYLADLGTGDVDIAPDGAETARLFWTSARQALAMIERGEIGVIFPTLRNLERLALFGGYHGAREQAETIAIREIRPVIETREDGEWLTIPDDQGYPVTEQRLETALRGDAKKQAPIV